MAQTNRTPRTMTNKFDSTCGDCGRHVDKGETILYHGRGYIQCSDCAPVNSTPTKPTTSAQAWQDALAWDSDEPAAGSSIGGTATAVKAPAKVSPIKPVDNRDNCEHCGALAELSHHDATGQALCNDCEKHHDQMAADDAERMARIGTEIIDQAAAKVDPLDDISNADRAEALTSELLIILVNAIDVSGISGRHTLAAFCQDNAKRSIDMSSRQHIWNGIRKAIQQA